MYRAEHAAVPVEIAFTGWREQAGLLRSGDADVAIVVEPFDTTSLDHEPLMSESQRLAVPAGHPFADNPRLRMADVESRYVQAGPDTHVYVPRGAQPTHAAAERAARRQLPGGIASRRPNSVCSFPR
nr:LysR family transcriptional regulator substrate-binding protein [Gordonia bronchialis]